MSVWGNDVIKQQQVQGFCHPAVAHLFAQCLHAAFLLRLHGVNAYAELQGYLLVALALHGRHEHGALAWGHRVDDLEQAAVELFTETGLVVFLRHGLATQRGVLGEKVYGLVMAQVVDATMIHAAVKVVAKGLERRERLAGVVYVYEEFLMKNCLRKQTVYYMR